MTRSEPESPSHSPRTTGKPSVSSTRPPANASCAASHPAASRMVSGDALRLMLGIATYSASSARSSASVGRIRATVTRPLALEPAAGSFPVTPVAPWRDQLTSALVGLGWSVKEADGAVLQLAPVADEQIVATGSVEVAVLLRQALQLLGRA